MNKTNFIKKQPESTPCGVRRRRENHARLSRAGNRGFEVIYANEVSERSERGRESRAQALRSMKQKYLTIIKYYCIMIAIKIKEAFRYEICMSDLRLCL